jgi:hypothetical protein
MKPAGLGQQELEKRRKAPEIKKPNNGSEQLRKLQCDGASM